MKICQNLLLGFLLTTVLSLSVNINLAYADDAVEIFNTWNGDIYFYGYDPQTMPPTAYADLELEQAGQYMLKVWGGPYLAAGEQICFSLVNTTDNSIGLPTDYDFEVEIDGQWYLLFREV